jgi:glutamine cyclotransferase
MIQIIPDWTAHTTRAKLPVDYDFPFRYEGDGLYLTDTGTVVIQSDGETYLQVSVYNSPLMLTAMYSP